jgi:2-polyprenyl-6-methoxyphenol hydroxylase-like FAD-dependent oxidoreductase
MQVKPSPAQIFNPVNLPETWKHFTIGPLLRCANPPSMSHAVVVGGSVAGLLAARVLLNHFDRVTLLERDRFPETPAPRPGIPQAQHVHALLMAGHRILEDLFPNLTADLMAKGALLLDWSRDWRYLTLWGWMPQEPSHLKGLICSRLLLEWYLRDRLLQMPGLDVREATAATGLVVAGPPARITGVTLAHNGTPQTLMADWVVDASGRNSKLSDWLVEQGGQRPPETIGVITKSYPLCRMGW